MTDIKRTAASLLDVPSELLQVTEDTIKQLEKAIERADGNSAELAILHAAHERLDNDYAAYVEVRIALAHELERAQDLLEKAK